MEVLLNYLVETKLDTLKHVSPTSNLVVSLFNLIYKAMAMANSESSVDITTHIDKVCGVLFGLFFQVLRSKLDRAYLHYETCVALANLWQNWIENRTSCNAVMQLIQKSMFFYFKTIYILLHVE